MITPSQYRKQSEGGFTIIELLIVMAILGMLAVMVAPNLFSKADGARRDAALSQISAVSSVLSQHRLDVGRYPDDLEGLIENTTGRASWDGPYIQNSVPKDPWGNEYFYESDGSSFTLMSYGADGVEGGEGNDADIRL
ncbi:MAG: type II secretion system major pseudopilin GspG [Pseudohongiellaceae bacterium]|nr:type II secretion system major pseudopilin GspG [Pseudohongiellaceae bacterium]